MSDTKHFWALPDGINEALPAEAQQLETLRRQLIDLFQTWGYQLVMPPLVEYMESLSTGVGSNLDLQTFKLTDQLSGRQMGVRADMTPQVARMDAHQLQNAQQDDHINRLCYIGTVLRTRGTHREQSRSPQQVGAELFGHAGIDSDYEVISLLLSALQLCSVPNVVLDLGHAGIFKGVVKQAGLNSDQEKAYFSMVERKSLPEIRDWLAEHDFDADTQTLLSSLPNLHGAVAVLDDAKTLLSDSPEATQAIETLQQLTQRIQARFPDCKLHIDLSELSGYNYHTGVIYAAYSSDTGQEIARGGRYDGIGELFGRTRPATGFSTDLRLLTQFAASAPAQREAVFAPAEQDSALETLIHDLRQQGQVVIRQLDGQAPATPSTAGCSHEITRKDGQWTVTRV